MGGRTQEYIIPHPTDNQSLHWPLDDSAQCPRSPPVFPSDCLPAFSDLFMLFFKRTPPPNARSSIGSLSISGGERRLFPNLPVYEKQTRASDRGAASRVGGGRIVISGERCCQWMPEGQSVHRGVSSKFHSGISGQPVPLDGISSRATRSA